MMAFSINGWVARSDKIKTRVREVHLHRPAGTETTSFGPRIQGHHSWGGVGVDFPQI